MEAVVGGRMVYGQLCMPHGQLVSSTWVGATNMCCIVFMFLMNSSPAYIFLATSPTFLFKTDLKLQSFSSGPKPLVEAACLCNTTWHSGDVLDDRHDVVVSAMLRKADPISFAVFHDSRSDASCLS